MLVDLSTELLERDEKLAEKNQEMDELVENLDIAIHEKLCAQKMKSHYKTELRKKSIENSANIFNSMLDGLKQRITVSENEKLEIEEVLLKGDEICFLKMGKMLMKFVGCMNSTNNVEIASGDSAT